MTGRTCKTCKHFEPAPIRRKGWCRNPLLYSPQQSHLVQQDDLDCGHRIGNYWEPAEPPADAEAAATLLRELLEPGDMVLVKGSRAVGLERVAANLTE